MKGLNIYLIEKLRINKNIQTTPNFSSEKFLKELIRTGEIALKLVFGDEKITHKDVEGNSVDVLSIYATKENLKDLSVNYTFYDTSMKVDSEATVPVEELFDKEKLTKVYEYLINS